MNPFHTLAYYTARLGLRTVQRITLSVDGLSTKPTHPVIFASNHTHPYDFLPIRVGFGRQGIPLSTWIKARSFEPPLQRLFLHGTENIPIPSRGSLIAEDMGAVWGSVQRPNIYRAIRDHLDHNTPLPQTAFWEHFQTHPRTLHGVTLHPSQRTWRSWMHDVYRSNMARVLAQTRAMTHRGHSIHIYPQGSVSTRLSQGRSGVIQCAHALGMDVVPLGCSGWRAACKGTTHHVSLRVGPVVQLNPHAFTTPIRPFDPLWEAAEKNTLQRETDSIMHAINDLLDDDERGDPNACGDGTQGMARFTGVRRISAL